MKNERNLPALHKERHKLKYRSTSCLNCYHPLDISEEFCPNCSQLNSTKKLAFNDFFNEFFAGIFAYDSRFYRTLGVLLFKPGKISKDYIEGKRVRYANPYRFYLSASIIFFLIWSLTHEVEPPVEIDQEATREQQIQADSILAARRADNPQLDILIPPVAIAEDTTRTDKYVPETALDTMSFSEAFSTRWEVFSDHYERTEIRNPHVALDSLNYADSNFNQWFYKKTVDVDRFSSDSDHYERTEVRNPHVALDSLNYADNNFNQWFYKKTVDVDRFSSDSDLFWNYFYAKVPFIIFFYLPVFALFLWLLYLRRPFTYMEHLIFTFHNQTTWFVFYGISINLDAIFNSNAFTWIATGLFGFYLYKAFRRFYGQGRVKTLLKFIIINFIFIILAFVAAILSILASFAIY